MKSTSAAITRTFEDIPNIGPRMAEDFRRLGLRTPADLRGKDALTLYKKMCKLLGRRVDPCVLDTYMAAIDFMNGAPARPWYRYTAKRKKLYPDI